RVAAGFGWDDDGATAVDILAFRRHDRQPDGDNLLPQRPVRGEQAPRCLRKRPGLAAREGSHVRAKLAAQVRLGDGAASTRRATAWPTTPLPPSNITVRSARSMQALDRSDLLPGELAPMALGQLAEPDRAGGHDVRPTNVREAGHLGEQPEHGAPPLRIGATDDVADRFVEREPSGARRAAYGTAVDRDLLGIGIDA